MPPCIYWLSGLSTPRIAKVGLKPVLSWAYFPPFAQDDSIYFMNINHRIPRVLDKFVKKEINHIAFCRSRKLNAFKKIVIIKSVCKKVGFLLVFYLHEPKRIIKYRIYCYNIAIFCPVYCYPYRVRCPRLQAQKYGGCFSLL